MGEGWVGDGGRRRRREQEEGRGLMNETALDDARRGPSMVEHRPTIRRARVGDGVKCSPPPAANDLT
nr:hypothetical protein CFP56_29972 [Quercus suber]